MMGNAQGLSEVGVGLERAKQESLESVGLSLVHLGQFDAVLEFEQADAVQGEAAVLAGRAVFGLRRGLLAGLFHALLVHVLGWRGDDGSLLLGRYKESDSHLSVSMCECD